MLAAVAQGNVDTADHIGVIVLVCTNVANQLKHDDDAKIMGANVRNTLT